MTKQEFTERTGIQVTDEQYKVIEQIYMNAGDLDKDLFCQDYAKHSDSIIIKEYFERSKESDNTIKHLNTMVKDLVSTIIDQAEQYSSIELRNKAIEILGLERYISIKLQRGYNLWQVDRDSMIEYLSSRSKSTFL